MRFIKNTASKLKIILEIFKFLWERKLWWLIPFIIVLLAFGLLFVLAQSSSVAPFIYTLF